MYAFRQLYAAFLKVSVYLGGGELRGPGIGVGALSVLPQVLQLALHAAEVGAVNVVRPGLRLALGARRGRQKQGAHGGHAEEARHCSRASAAGGETVRSLRAIQRAGDDIGAAAGMFQFQIKGALVRCCAGDAIVCAD